MESELTLTNAEYNTQRDAVCGVESFDEAKAGDAHSH